MISRSCLDWEIMQQPAERVVTEMPSQTDIRQDWEILQQPTERVVIEMSSETEIK
jgi:hypothetical protein